MGRIIVLLFIQVAMFPLLLNGQTHVIDSLCLEYYKINTEAKKLDAVLRLLEEHHSMQRDSLSNYVKVAGQLSQHADSRRKNLALLGLANEHLRWGWTDSALVVSEIGLKQNPLSDPATRDIYFKFMRVRVMSYGTRSDYKRTLALLYQLISEAEQYRDSVMAGANLNTIGSVSLAMNEPEKALEWFFKSLSYTATAGKFNQNRAAIYVNMANAYLQQGKEDSGLYYVRKGIAISREMENLNILASGLRVQSNLFMNKSQLKDAEAALQEMFNVRKKMTGGTQMIVDDNLLLIDFYLTTKQVDKAIQLCKENLVQGNIYDSISNQGKLFNNNIRIRLPYYEALARSYKIAGNTKLYQETLEKVIAAKDSFYETNAADAIAELQTKYDVQKKETTIVTQKLDLVRKNNLVYGSFGLLLFSGIIAYLGFSNYRKKQQMHLFEMQDEEKRMSAIAVIKAEENERKRISADLHDNLGAYANAVLYNTELLQQEADEIGRKELLSDLQYASKDIIISLRETIWALKKDTYTAEECLLRIRNFVQPFTRYYPQISFAVEGTAPEHFVLHGSKSLHLVRMIQEAVNNSIKHAYSKKISVSSSHTPDFWKVVVEDDGKGFPGQTFSAGNEQNGLANLRDRAINAGITLSIQSEPGKGTAIEMIISAGT